MAGKRKGTVKKEVGHNRAGIQGCYGNMLPYIRRKERNGARPKFTISSF
jgi:hypothetical protein